MSRRNRERHLPKFKVQAKVMGADPLAAAEDMLLEARALRSRDPKLGMNKLATAIRWTALMGDLDRARMLSAEAETWEPTGVAAQELHDAQELLDAVEAQRFRPTR
jgi:hypothetical protein